MPAGDGVHGREASGTGTSTAGEMLLPPFLVVRDAGHAPVNGRYIPDGTLSGKPKYKQVGGHSIIFFMEGRWRLNDEDVTDERCYDALVEESVESVEVEERMEQQLSASASAVPPSEWVQFQSRFGAVPRLAFGTGRDLQEDDVVTISSSHEELDWSGCPENEEERRLSLSSAPWTLRVQKLSGGDWFYSTEFPQKVVPVAAVDVVNLMGKAFRVCLEGNSELKPRASRATTHGGHGGSEAASNPEPPPTPFLVVVGAGHSRVNGRYVHDGTFSGKPRYKQVDGTSIIFFTAGKWRLNDEEITDERCYDGMQGDVPMPPDAWVQTHHRYGTVPQVSVGTGRDLLVGDVVSIVKGQDEVDWSGCPESDRAKHLPLATAAGRGTGGPRPRTVTVHRLLGEWFYPREASELIAPVAALGTVTLMGKPQLLETRVSTSAPNPSGAEAAPTPFLVVAGAGYAPVNGRYVHDGTYAGKPRYKQVSGNSIIYFMEGRWRMNDGETTAGEPKYEAPPNHLPMPPCEWSTDLEEFQPAPTLSMGTCKDIQEGDQVTIVAWDEDVDWSGCPESSEARLRFSPSSWTVTVHRVTRGAWFYPKEFETLVAPLAALGLVNFMGKAYSIHGAQRGPARSPAMRNLGKEEKRKGKIGGGHDEDWCDEPATERFKCAICLLVARGAMVHKCGSVLFCKSCWKQSTAKNGKAAKCPVCRKGGASVQAHCERRCIDNLQIRCPKRCGATFPLCEKVL
ncbi:TNF receptor-associated factor 6-B [Durusdinium trenchii]|uniref:TNF receptor-associated factor 6-B n=1 Tax=Durusdinium trenchii TaxID=1381693 RepID=A0ABP0S072_9DINO